MLNLYMLYTPFDVLLSMAIAAMRPDDDNLLFFVRIPETLTKEFKTLSEIFPSINARFYAFPNENIENSNVRNFFQKKRQVKLLEEVIRREGPDRIFYNQEWNVYTTRAVYYAQQLNPNVTFHFLDDGVYTYTETTKKQKPFIERILDRIAWGAWHQCPAVPGTLQPDCSVWVLFPDLLPKIFDEKEKIRIDLDPLMKQIDPAALRRATHTEGKSEVEAIVTTDFDDTSAGEEYRKIIGSVISDCCAAHLKTALKRHPADNRGIPFAPEGCEIDELSSLVPVELYYIRFRNSLKKITGTLSGTLLTARAMLPDAEAECIVTRKYLKMGRNAEIIVDFFARTGVKITMID